MARFFIDRPIFAWVLAIIVMLAGGLSAARLPISQYPAIAPPTVTINAVYPGASAKAVEDSVTQLIEQQMKGLDGLLYMSSTSESNGVASLTLTFRNGTDPDIAQVQVQNKLQLATPSLPQIVQQQGISVSKANSGFLMVIGFVSEDGSMGGDDVQDYVAANLVDPIARVPGVGSTQVFGAKYAMRIWLDPNKLATYKLTPGDLTAAIRAQNQQVVVGQLGGTPAVPGQQLNATITAQDRLQTPEQFRNIVVRTNPDGSALKLGEVARVELGSEDYSFISRYNGKPATGLAVSLATGANALTTAQGVAAALEELEPTLPKGLKAVVPFDTTPFVRVAIQGVVVTLLEAILLVFLVMYLFLQNFRATLIPTIAVPVVLLGTLGVLSALGFSVNMLTMFAMVLAIGLLVDDAIVVVENVERVMSEEGLSPLEATRKSMEQITGALVGIGLVLSAVFVPMAFLGGSTGVIYRQFSVTIVSSMALSVLVAIVLTPALCATLLKPVARGHQASNRGFFGWFNRTFDRGNARYQRTVRGMLSRSRRFMLAFAAMVAVMVVLFLRLPSSFLPAEDQGFLFAMVQTPVGATQERTMKVIERVERHFLEEEKDAVDSLFSVQGFSFGGSGQNNGIAFLNLKDWSERTSPELGVNAVAGRAMGALSQIKDALAFAFPPPAVPELGTSAGFVFFLKDNLGLGHEALTDARNQFLGAAAQSPLLANVRPNGQEDTPQFRIDVDVAKAGALGLPSAEINSTLSAAWGGQY
ncbi:MAG: efflux RND transporter permease subunit, partial [Myxococcaceae bacterium]|nr:efflux RND transporter permease subunit [Myxococcaceae bacterium]